jgi:hypothetical protein
MMSVPPWGARTAKTPSVRGIHQAGDASYFDNGILSALRRRRERPLAERTRAEVFRVFQAMKIYS